MSQQRRHRAHLLAVLCASARAWNATCAPRAPCLRGLHEKCAAQRRPDHERAVPASHASRSPCAPCFGLDADRAAPARARFARHGGGSAASAAAGGAPTLCQLHMPKTGSGFAETLKRFACPGLGDALSRALGWGHAAPEGWRLGPRARAGAHARVEPGDLLLRRARANAAAFAARRPPPPQPRRG